MKKFEEEYHENQLFNNYFIEINNIIAPYLKFDASGNIVGLHKLSNINNDDKQIILSYLWKIELSRDERMQANNGLARNIKAVKELIDSELNKNK